MGDTLQAPDEMSVEEFLTRNPLDGQVWQLADGEPQAFPPADETHAAIRADLAHRLTRHLEECNDKSRVVLAAQIVPHVNAPQNLRLADLAVTRSPDKGGQAARPDPVLVIEILSADYCAKVRANVWTYSTIPSVQEIIVLHAPEHRAEVLRRQADGNWPHDPQTVTDGEIAFDSIGFRAPLGALYRTCPPGTAA